jgi:Domain of unknown function (DUF4249)
MKYFFQHIRHRIKSMLNINFSILPPVSSVFSVPPWFVLASLAGILCSGCKDPYNIKPKNSQQGVGVLVVEGFLNSGGVTTIRLSRSYSLAENTTYTAETGASVVIESPSGQYTLFENGAGVYNANLGTLDPSQQYRLHIHARGKEYISDYVKVQATPPIDSVGWTRDINGVTIYASTHDPANSSHYYRYDYVETWETHSPFIQRLAYAPGTPPDNVRPLGPFEQYYQCWKTQPSTSLTLATSTALQSDVIFQKPVVFIPQADEKLAIRYSILVKQYVLSKEAFDFFQLMKKNTESVGTIFDAQPSQITGNIHSVSDKNEQVIGIFYASSEQQKRIFISAADLPLWGFEQGCNFTKIPPVGDTVTKYANNGLLPYDADVAGIVILDYRVTSPGCFNCTVNGGTTDRPSFW